MLLYVNGDSHTAAAEAVNPHAFACDDGDGEFWRLGRRPHPDNDRVSWGYRLANLLQSAYINDSESASSNTRILRTSQDWVQSNQQLWPQLIVVIQWSTWERQEWLIEGEYYQVNASGIDHVPHSHRDQYREYIAGIDWRQCTQQWHDNIWSWHQWLQHHGIKHLFFNGNTCFDSVQHQHDWQGCYLDPYQKTGTFDQILRRNQHTTVNPKSWHFGAEAHCFWAQFLLQYCIDNQLVTGHALSTD